MRYLIRYRTLQQIFSFITSGGLFCGGFKLLSLGIEAKGSLEIKSSILSGTINAESAGLAMIFAGVIVFLAPFVFRAKIVRDRMQFRIMFRPRLTSLRVFQGG
jgi:hypothetical protein